jgi:hypothetical protein
MQNFTPAGQAPTQPIPQAQPSAQPSAQSALPELPPPNARVPGKPYSLNGKTVAIDPADGVLKEVKVK